MNNPGTLTFKCNICGTICETLAGLLSREEVSCTSCGSTVRMRGMMHALSIALFGRAITLPEFPERKDLVGKGMSDWEGYAKPLSKKLAYQNTYYHKSPNLDITNISTQDEQSVDFLVSTDVFEHVTPPVSIAFENAKKMLKPGGAFIFSVPYALEGDTQEHFPNLHKFSLETKDNKRTLINCTKEGSIEEFSDLVFHGGEGDTLEMRVFSEASLLNELDHAGFHDVQIMKEPYFEFGIYLSETWSLPIIAREKKVPVRVSIIVLCYNGLDEVTRPCLESVIANTPLTDYELILVDNASNDGTAEYLKSFAEQYSHVLIQLNDSNKGYAGGNNDGIELASGQYVVLLNNDTLVSAGWLDKLLNLFDEQVNVGLIGPVTNSAGNEQRIELTGLNEANFSDISGDYVEHQQGVWFLTEKLGFFCVAIRRKVLDAIGGLDERFGIGMFEDDDYCVRAKQAGFTLAVVEDCFIYHKGSVSFKKLINSDYIEIFNKNRNYFYEKHKIVWTYTDIATAIWSKINADLTQARNKDDRAALERIGVRINDMNDALHQLQSVECGSAAIQGQLFLELQLTEKHKNLMEISDWATIVHHENERLVEKQKNMMDLSDWASNLKREMDEMSRSWFYRIFRFVQRRGI